MSQKLFIETLRKFINEAVNDSLKIIEKTRNGVVYQMNDGKVLKITKDQTEYENALKFIDKPSKYFIHYYSANPLNDGTYQLVMEKITPLNEKEWDIVDLIQQTLGRQDYMLNDQRRYQFLNELKANPEFYTDFATYPEMVYFVTVLKGMYQEAQRRGITLYDLRAQNIGRTTQGNVVHFDIGAG